MDQSTLGTVILVSKQWWLKINTKPIRAHTFDGAIFPHIITVRYIVNGTEYLYKKWIHAGHPTPAVGENVSVFYREEKPSKARIELCSE